MNVGKLRGLLIGVEDSAEVLVDGMSLLAVRTGELDGKRVVNLMSADHLRDVEEGAPLVPKMRRPS